MSSTFFGLNISVSGLSTSQRALNVTSHNISNANTEGYSRQRVDFRAATPDTIGGQGIIGTGTVADPVKQIRDEFLDFSFRGENSRYGEFDKKYEIFTSIEGIINEPSDSGFTTLMNNFFTSVQELSKNPESLTTRALVRQRALSMVAGINHVNESFKSLQRDLNFEVGVAVDEINGYAKQIAKLNEQIYKTELDGGTANDIRDQRSLALDKLSKIASIQYYEDDKNRFHVAIQGHELVSHMGYKEICVEERVGKNNEDDVEGLYDIKWKDGSTFNIIGGKLKGIRDMRDGAADTSKGIPYYVSKLNEFVNVFATEMNRVHSSGYDLSGETGTYFFTKDGMSTEQYKNYIVDRGFEGSPSPDVTESVLSGTSGLTGDELRDRMRDNVKAIVNNNPSFAGKTITALDGKYYVVDMLKAGEFSLSSDLDGDLNRFAASTTLTGIPGNAQNALNMADVRHDNALFDWGSPDDFVRTLTSNLGVDGQEAKRVSETQEVLLNAVTTRRDSVSGVSLDEEMSEMLKFQHAYNANARMLTTIDGILDTIINKMGLVGR